MATAKKNKIDIAFSVGDWVTARWHVLFDYEREAVAEDADIWTLNNARQWRRIQKREREIIGQVVGGAFRQVGEYHGMSGDSEDGPDPAYLAIEEAVFVYLVREGFLNRPLEVLPEDLRSADPLKRLPRLKSRQPVIDDRYRELMRQAAREMPRANGRFSK